MVGVIVGDTTPPPVVSVWIPPNSVVVLKDVLAVLLEEELLELLEEGLVVEDGAKL